MAKKPMAKKPIHVCTKEKELAEMHTDIQWIKKTVAKIDKSINGNGQPGFTQRIISLENWRSYILGIMALATFIVLLVVNIK